MVKRLQAKMLPTKKKDYAVQSLRGEIDRLEEQQMAMEEQILKAISFESTSWKEPKTIETLTSTSS